MYLQSRLKKKLLQRKVGILKTKIPYPCSQGALLHYMFEEDVPPMENATFYTVQCEPFDRRVHADFAAPQKKRKREDYPQQRPKRKQPPAKKRPRPEQSEWDKKELVVEGRLLPLMKIGAGNEIEASRVLMEFHINAKFGPRVHLEVYRTTRPDLHRAHGPSKDGDGNLLEGLVQYPVAFVDLPELSEFFKAKDAGKDEDGVDQSFYTVSGLVEMFKAGDTLKVVVTLLRSSFDWERSEDGMFLFPLFTQTSSRSHTVPQIAQLHHAAFYNL
jgi:hypothetical protein